MADVVQRYGADRERPSTVEALCKRWSSKSREELRDEDRRRVENLSFLRCQNRMQVDGCLAAERQVWK
jgi:hypothetical protein